MAARARDEANALAAVLEALFPPDPGWLRLRQAARATIAGAITLLVANRLGAERGISGPTELFGFAMGLFMAASLHDPTPAAQRVTILLAPLPASLASLLAALVRPVPVLGEACFVAVLTATVYAAARGPRWGSLATVAMIAYLLGLIGVIPLAEVPARVLIAVLAAAAALFAHSVLLPEIPGRVLARIEADVRRRVRAIQGMLAAAVRAGLWRPGARARLRQAVGRLDEAVVAADAALAGAARGRVLGLEALDLACERVAWKILARLPAAAERREVADALAGLGAGGAAGGVPLGSPLGAAIGSPLGAAIGALGQALSGTMRVAAPAVAARAEAGRARAQPATQPPTRPPLRRVAQAALAIGIAVVLGGIVMPGRWYWAAFAAFVVFLGTRSRGESIAKAAQFMLGTIAGVVAGTLVATALSGHPYLSLAGIIVAVFLAFQASTVAYGMMMFWITIILGLLFGMLGFFAPDLLLTRLVEAAIGSASGVAVAAIVWVVPTSDVVTLAERAYLQGLASVVEAAGRCLASGVRDPGPLALLLALEGRFASLGAAARPQTLGLLAGARARPRRRMWLLAACHYRVRDLVRLAGEEGKPDRAAAGPAAPGPAAPGPAAPEVAASEVAAAAARVAAEARRLAGEPAGKARPPAPANGAPDGAPDGVDDPRLDTALLLLHRIAALLRRLGPG